MGMSVGSRNLNKAPLMWGLGVEGKSCRQCLARLLGTSEHGEWFGNFLGIKGHLGILWRVMISSGLSFEHITLIAN